MYASERVNIFKYSKANPVMCNKSASFQAIFNSTITHYDTVTTCCYLLEYLSGQTIIASTPQNSPNNKLCYSWAWSLLCIYSLDQDINHTSVLAKLSGRSNHVVTLIYNLFNQCIFTKISQFIFLKISGVTIGLGPNLNTWNNTSYISKINN